MAASPEEAHAFEQAAQMRRELAGDGEILYRVDRFLTPEDVRRGA